MENKSEFVQVEVVNNSTEKTVMSFQAKAEDAISNAYNRVANCFNLDRTIASMNYHVNITK